MFFIYLLAIAYAHNWIHGASRAGKASQTIPAPPRRSARDPHRQVGAGQEFGVEWVNGHPGTYYYFIVLKATDEDKLVRHTEKLLNDYIAKAPKSAYIYDAPKWQKMHVSCTNKYPKSPAGRGDCASTAYNSGKSYERVLTKDDDIYMDRSGWHPNPGSDMTHFKYKASQIANDKRVSYESKDYPWIEAVHRFRVSVKFPKEWDLARFSLPARQGSGEYMIHMVWRGYRDVIDIDVLPKPAADIYGKSGANKQFIKTEHCMYPNYSNHRNTRCYFMQAGASAKTCMDACVSRGWKNCRAINVVPLFTPDNVKIQGNRIYDAKVPWHKKGGSKFCKHDDKSGKWLPKSVNKDTMVCYHLVPRQPTDPAFNPETEDYWQVRDEDPEDPTFYSSCYRLEVKREFTGNVACPKCEGAPSENQLRWQVGDKCLDCNNVKPSEDVSKIQFWKTSDVCEKCF